MTDYISREAVLAFADRVRYVKNEDVEAGIQGVLIFVRDEIPAVPMREVVRGNWVRVGDTDNFRCSRCNKMILATWDMPAALFNFCPNCGAEMKGEADGT